MRKPIPSSGTQDAEEESGAFIFERGPGSLPANVESQVSFHRSIKLIHIGLVADEPIRLAGLVSIFESQNGDGQGKLIPVTGTLSQLLSYQKLEYLVIDLNSTSGGVETLEHIRKERPDIRLIVIGPEGNDELVLNSIIAGARAYLDLSAGPQTVWTAIGAVSDGSIWAPRRLLSKLIDRLLDRRDTSLTNGNSHLTAREEQVLELILTARSNREIASQLGIEERTVKAHLGRLMRKAGVNNRIELSMRALSGSITARKDRRAEGDSNVTSWGDS
jgi:DNA-binding NarL/FixJ family response regulator